MGGEYPLASSHSAESSENSGDGARNVALLYLFGSGGGQALCPLVTYMMLGSTRLEYGGLSDKWLLSNRFRLISSSSCMYKKDFSTSLACWWTSFQASMALTYKKNYEILSIYY